MSFTSDLAAWTEQPWLPSSIPASTTLTSIATSHASALHQTLSSVIELAAIETDLINMRSLSQVYRGAAASLSIISAEEILATGTAPEIQSQATQAVFNATLDLKNWQKSKTYMDRTLMPRAIIFIWSCLR